MDDDTLALVAVLGIGAFVAWLLFGGSSNGGSTAYNVGAGIANAVIGAAGSAVDTGLNAAEGAASSVWGSAVNTFETNFNTDFNPFYQSNDSGS